MDKRKSIKSISSSSPPAPSPQKVEELRGRLILKGGLTKDKIKSDKFLSRYLQFNEGSVDQAEKMLQFYIQRNRGQSSGSDLLTTKFPVEMTQDFRCFIGGWDYENRPVIMVPDMTNFNVKKYMDRVEEAEILSDYFLRLRLCLEQSCLERDVDYGVVVADLSHFQYAQYLHKKTVEFIMEAFRLTEMHSPGVARIIILVNAPRIIKMIIDMVKKVVKLNVDIVTFGSFDKGWRDRLRDYFPACGICTEFGGTLNTSEMIQI